MFAFNTHRRSHTPLGLPPASDESGRGRGLFRIAFVAGVIVRYSDSDERQQTYSCTDTWLVTTSQQLVARRAPLC